MSQTRIYLPLTIAGLDALASGAEVGPAPLAAYTVTDALAAALPTADEEEREYAAFCDAAEAAGSLRVSRGDRRVLAAADVDPAVVSEEVDAGHTKARTSGHRQPPLSRARVVEAVPLRRIVSFHVDEVGGVEDDELLWYDVTEIDDVRHLLRS